MHLGHSRLSALSAHGACDASSGVLTAGEIRHVMETARRLAAILLLGPALDESFRACAKPPAPAPA